VRRRATYVSMASFNAGDRFWKSMIARMIKENLVRGRDGVNQKCGQAALWSKKLPCERQIQCAKRGSSQKTDNKAR
jgi:hypothetical protein